EGRIEPAHGRECGAPDDEEVRDIPALAVAIDYGGLWIASHARPALMVSTRRARAQRGAPHLHRPHGASDLLHLLHHELDARKLVRPSPVVGQARRRQAPALLPFGGVGIAD